MFSPKVTVRDGRRLQVYWAIRLRMRCDLCVRRESEDHSCVRRESEDHSCVRRESEDHSLSPFPCIP